MSTGTGLARQAGIVEHAIGGQNRAFVDPPHIRIGKGTERAKFVKLTNGTTDAVTLWFPNGRLIFDGSSSEPPVPDFSHLIDIRKGHSIKLKVKDEPKEGHYHYHVYCAAVQDCAQGNSEPGLHVP